MWQVEMPNGGTSCRQGGVLSTIGFRLLYGSDLVALHVLPFRFQPSVMEIKSCWVNTSYCKDFLRSAELLRESPGQNTLARLLSGPKHHIRYSQLLF